MSVFDKNSRLGKKIVDIRGIYKLLTLLAKTFVKVKAAGDVNTPIYIDASGNIQVGETIGALTNPEIKEACDKAEDSSVSVQSIT